MTWKLYHIFLPDNVGPSFSTTHILRQWDLRIKKKQQIIISRPVVPHRDKFKNKIGDLTVLTSLI